MLAAVARGIDTFIDVIGRITAWASFALAVLMATNVLLRYGFSAGSVWAQELEWHLMVVICMFGASYALRHGDHVRVDVLFARMSRRWQLRIDLVTALTFVVVCGLIIALSYNYVATSWRIQETTTNPGGVPYRFLLKTLLPVGFVLLGLQSIAKAIHALTDLRELPR